MFLSKSKENDLFPLEDHRDLSANGSSRLESRYSNSTSTIKQKEFRFIGCVRNRNDLEGFLEAVFIAQLLKSRYQTRAQTSLILHEDNKELASKCSLFDHLHPCSHENKIKDTLLSQISQKTDLLYIPSHDIYAHWVGRFSSSRMRTAGFGSNVFSRFLRLQKIGGVHRIKGKKRNHMDLHPEKVLPYIEGKLHFPSKTTLPKNQFVWLSLFEKNNINRHWPASYVTRLTRILGKDNLSVVTSLPSPTSIKNNPFLQEIKSEIEYLKKYSGYTMHFYEDLNPQERAAVMQQALAVVCPSGQDSILASLLRRPLVTLHDMRSHETQNSIKASLSKKSSRSETKRLGSLTMQKKQGNTLAFPRLNLFTSSEKEIAYYMHSPYVKQRHITPTVDECIQDCIKCPYNSCVEHISPEQVHEGLKKILFSN